MPLSGQFLQHVSGDVEIRVDLVDVVLVVERVEQLEHPLSIVPFHFDAAFRLRDQSRGLDLDAFAFERFPDGGQGGQLADHPQFVLVLTDVFGAGVDRPDQVVLAVAAAVDHDRALFLEDPGDRTGLAEAAPVFGEGVPDLGAGAVVGQGLDEDGYAGRAVTLVDNPFDRGAVASGPGADVDRLLDFVLRHRGFFGLLDRRRQGRVAADVAAAVAGGYRDRARELAEELAAFSVGGALLVFDRVPLGMPGHRLAFYESPHGSERENPQSRTRAGRRPRLRRHAAGCLLALDGDPAELGLHRLEALRDAVPERGPYAVVAVGIVASI